MSAEHEQLTVAICDDCGAVVDDWIETFTGSILCLPCADAWEEFEVSDDQVQA